MALKAWSELTFESQISFKTDVWWWQMWPLWNKVGTWNFMCFLNVHYHCQNWSGFGIRWGLNLQQLPPRLSRCLIWSTLNSVVGELLWFTTFSLLRMLKPFYLSPFPSDLTSSFGFQIQRAFSLLKLPTKRLPPTPIPDLHPMWIGICCGSLKLPRGSECSSGELGPMLFLPKRTSWIVWKWMIQHACFVTKSPSQFATYSSSVLLQEHYGFQLVGGFKAEEHTLRSHSDIVQLILNPPPSLCPAYDQWLVSLNMAFTLDEIWQTRNVVLHLKAPVDIQASR